jgi:hypothetical protein
MVGHSSPVIVHLSSAGFSIARRGFGVATHSASPATVVPSASDALWEPDGRADPPKLDTPVPVPVPAPVEMPVAAPWIAVTLLEELHLMSSLYLTLMNGLRT